LVVTFPAASRARTRIVTNDALRLIDLRTSLCERRFSLTFSLTGLPAGANRRTALNLKALTNGPLRPERGILIRTQPAARIAQRSFTQVATTDTHLGFACLARAFSRRVTFVRSRTTVKLRVAGVGSALLKGGGSTANTEKVCGPSPRPPYVRLPVLQAMGAPPSIEQLKRESGSLEEKVKVTAVELVTGGGPELTVVWGAV
jgi:hypothetical protein